MENAVGPVLRMCDEVELIIEAIQDDNPDTEIEVIDRGAYVRVHAPGFMRLTLATLRGYLGDDFAMADITKTMSAFAGRINTTSDQITWALMGDGGGIRIAGDAGL